MRRLLALLIAVLGAALAVSLVGAPAQSAGTYRVDAIFDTAKGIIPGQVVKIAGARVGSIEDVRLTKDYKARILMSVPRQFDFYSDASCNIQPEGLISENFVQCDPGTPGKPKLGGQPVPTVPVQRTSVPVSITDLFRIFQADVRQRFTVAMMALGGGLAARGDDLNAIILRANPTLAAVRRLTRDLAAQKASLDAAVTDTDRVIAALAQRKDKVTAFIQQAANVTRQTAAHRSQLADSIRKLPPLLGATDTAVGQLDRLLANGRPLLGELRAAAPGLDRAVSQVAPFARVARPSLIQLGRVSDIALPVIADAKPIVRLLRRFTTQAGPAGRNLADLLVSLRDAGGLEYAARFVYFSAAATARYDGTSHVLPAHAVDSLTCATYSTTPTQGCNAFFRAPGPATTRAQTRSGRRRGRRPGDASATPTPAAPGAAPTPNTPGATPTPEALAPILKPVQDLLGKLQPLNPKAAQDLTDFLLGP